MLKCSAALVPPGKAVLLPVLLDLNAGETPLVRATFLRRPSERNKSPMVADVELADGRVVLAHVPSMDLGGKCVAGKILLLKPAMDAKGRLVGPDAKSAKYDTPKCEFIAQLVRVDGCASTGTSDVWVGAHPGLGEKLAEAMVQGKHLDACFGDPHSATRQLQFCDTITVNLQYHDHSLQHHNRHHAVTLLLYFVILLLLC
jgi:hypothetical protein